MGLGKHLSFLVPRSHPQAERQLLPPACCGTTPAAWTTQGVRTLRRLPSPVTSSVCPSCKARCSATSSRKPSQVTPAFTVLSAGTLGAALGQPPPVAGRRRGLLAQGTGSDPSPAAVCLGSGCLSSEPWLPRVYDGGTSPYLPCGVRAGGVEESVFSLLHR